METFVIGVIVSTRGFFNPELAQKGREKLLKKLDDMGYKTICLDETQTNYGLVETLEDAKKCAKLFKEYDEEIKGILVSLPNFGDEVGVVNAVKMSNLNVPVLVQAFDDEVDKMDLSGRRDAFCGKLSVCNNFYQFGLKFTDTTYHTCSIDSEVFTKDLENFEAICRVVGGLKNLRVAQIGTRPAPFQTVRYSEKLLQQAGITVVPVDLSEIIFSAQAMADSNEVDAMVNRMRSYGKIDEDVPEENVIKQAKLYLTVKEWMLRNGCQAGTIQCWDSLQKNYGCASCLTMSMLGEEGIPMACEVDVMGAVSMYALYLASLSPAGYLDWNNSCGEDRDKCINIHCSNYPKTFIGKEFQIGNLDILGKSLGFEKCFGACKGAVRSGNMTYAKVSTDDVTGKIKVYAGEGDFTDDPIETLGGVAVCHVPNLQNLMKYICKNGFEHHVAMSRGNVVHILEEALGNYMGWEFYLHYQK